MKTAFEFLVFWLGRFATRYGMAVPLLVLFAFWAFLFWLAAEPLIAIIRKGLRHD